MVTSRAAIQGSSKNLCCTAHQTQKKGPTREALKARLPPSFSRGYFFFRLYTSERFHRGKRWQTGRM